MVHLYIGDGKGKTTAAVGQAVRAAGNGLRVLFLQFMKGADSGEVPLLAACPGIEVRRSPKDYGFYRSMGETEKAELTRIHNELLREALCQAQNGQAELIVLDEITYPLKWGLLGKDLLERLLFSGTAGWPEIVCTGRDAPADLEARADYLTRMECVKHPYQKGVRARKGIEY